MAEEGLPGVILLHALSPLDVCNYRKNHSNQFHESGAGINHCEALDTVPDATASWDAYAAKLTTKVADFPQQGPFSYTKVHEKHIMGESQEVFGSPDGYRAARAVHTGLTALGAHADYMEDYGDLADDDLPVHPSIVLHNSKELVF